MKNHYSKLLFPIHLHQIHIKENLSIQREVLSSIQKCYEEKDLPIPDGWLTDKLYTSFDLDEINHAIFSEDNIIHQIYRKYVEMMFDKRVELSLEDMWFNYYVNGEYQEPHSHIAPTVLRPPVHYSCIHYLKYDDEVHLSTVFHDPIEDLRAHSYEMDSNHYSSKWSPRVKEGDLIMFPSYLQHHVSKSQPTPDNPRITIAFNLRLLSYGD